MTWQRTIWIAGVARSGTSWVGQIFNSHPQVRFRFQPLFSYEFKDRVSEDSTPAEFSDFLNELWTSESEFLTQSDKAASGEYPNFDDKPCVNSLVFKENRYQSLIEPMLRRVPQLQVVGIVRHPCAVIHSWSQNEKEFPAGSVLREQWRFGECKNTSPADYFGFYKWKEVANLYLDLADQYPDRVQVVRYADLLSNTPSTTAKMLKGCGLSYDSSVESFLTASRTQNSSSYYAVFKTKEDDCGWQGKLDGYIAEEILADLERTRLAQFLV